MPFTVNPEMTQGPQEDQMWRFRVTKTSEGSPVQELIYVPLPHAIVVQIYAEEIGLPGTGLALANVLDNWFVLEPRLRHEIGQRMPAHPA